MINKIFFGLMVFVYFCSSQTLYALTPDQELEKLLESIWQEKLAEQPEFAASMGFKAYQKFWTDSSLEAIKRRKEKPAKYLDALAKFNSSKLSLKNRLSLEVMTFNFQLEKEGSTFPNEYLNLTQMNGFHTDVPRHLSKLPLTNISDLEDYLALLRGVPKLIHQNMELLKLGQKTGVTPPQIALQGVPEQIKSLLIQGSTSPFARNLKAEIKDLDDTLLYKYQKDMDQIIASEIIPVYQKLYQFIEQDYLPHVRKSIGLSKMNRGLEWYQHLIRSNTTLNRSAEEIHATGKSEVTRIKAKLDDLIATIGFKGSFSDFAKFVTTDKQFFYKDKVELLKAYRAKAKEIDPHLIQYFTRLPALPYGVEAVPDYRANKSTTAYYEPGSMKAGIPGTFFTNTYDVFGQPSWEITALTMHEAVPGHHLQISIAAEQENIPEIRRHLEFTAFVEGWALYAESLGYPMGLYQDPYAQLGQLNYDIWRAIRLVVDTGIHAFGWTREQAIAYFRNNSCLTDKYIAVEVDRYIGWPGQALGYKIGQLTISDLKEKAKLQLGNKFDIKAFHDAVLEEGPLPLEVLKRQIEKKLMMAH